jgi:hypothetical protein
MGIEYLVADNKNKRIFWLGKGPWHGESRLATSLRVALCWREANLTARELAQALIDDCNAYYRDDCQEGVGSHPWQVGEKLHRFCTEAEWQIELLTDCNDYPYEWPEVASFYIGAVLDPDPLGGTDWAFAASE